MRANGGATLFTSLIYKNWRWNFQVSRFRNPLRSIETVHENLEAPLLFSHLDGFEFPEIDAYFTAFHSIGGFSFPQHFALHGKVDTQPLVVRLHSELTMLESSKGT